jgi:hypothetical protein
MVFSSKSQDSCVPLLHGDFMPFNAFWQKEAECAILQFDDIKQTKNTVTTKMVHYEQSGFSSTLTE